MSLVTGFEMSQRSAAVFLLLCCECCLAFGVLLGASMHIKMAKAYSSRP